MVAEVFRYKEEKWINVHNKCILYTYIQKFPLYMYVIIKKIHNTLNMWFNKDYIMPFFFPKQEIIFCLYYNILLHNAMIQFMFQKLKVIVQNLPVSISYNNHFIETYLKMPSLHLFLFCLHCASWKFHRGMLVLYTRGTFINVYVPISILDGIPF